MQQLQGDASANFWKDALAIMKPKVPFDVVSRCLRQLLGLEVCPRWSELHADVRWTICPLMFNPREEYTAFISCNYDYALSPEDMGRPIQRRCNVRFKSREEAVEAILERIVDFSWCNFDYVAFRTMKNPLLGKKSAEELEILLDVFKMQRDEDRSGREDG